MHCSTAVARPMCDIYNSLLSALEHAHKEHTAAVANISAHAAHDHDATYAALENEVTEAAAALNANENIARAMEAQALRHRVQADGDVFNEVVHKDTRMSETDATLYTFKRELADTRRRAS